MKIFAIGLCLTIVLLNFILYALLKKKINKTEVKRNTYTLSLPTRLYRYVKMPLYGASLAHVFIQPLLLNEQPYRVWLIVPGAVVGLCGLLLLYYSVKALGENFMPCYDGVLPSKRVSEGPYKFCKHPIYLSNVLQFIAVIIIIPGPIIYIVFALILWIYAYTIRDENRSLDRYFSDNRQ